MIFFKNIGQHLCVDKFRKMKSFEKLWFWLPLNNRIVTYITCTAHSHSHSRYVVSTKGSQSTTNTIMHQEIMRMHSAIATTHSMCRLVKGYNSLYFHLLVFCNYQCSLTRFPCQQCTAAWFFLHSGHISCLFLFSRGKKKNVQNGKAALKYTFVVVVGFCIYFGSPFCSYDI